MAKKDTLKWTLPLIVGSPKPSVKPKVKPKPKPTAKPVLDSDYEFVFDPSGWQSSEAQAVRALYADHTGGEDLAAQPDPQEALKTSGVIKPPTSSRGRALDRGATRSVYSSAQDAVDALAGYLNKEAGTFIGELTGKDVLKMYMAAGSGGLTQTFEPVSNVQIKGLPVASPTGGISQSNLSVGEALKAPFKGIGSLHEKWAAATKTGPNVAGHPSGVRPVTASNTTGLKDDPGMITRPVANAITAFGSAIGDFRVPFPRPFYINVGPGGGYVYAPEQVRLGDANVKLQDIAEHTNKYIDAASDDKSNFTDDPFINQLKDKVINGGLLAEEINIQMNLERQSPKDQQTWSGFAEPDINAMQIRAAKNGWPFDPLKPGGSAAWKKLTPAEWLYYAYTKNSYWFVLGRSLIRAAALTGLAPAGIIGIAATGVKAAGGDTEDGKIMLEYALAPVKSFQSDSEKYGVGVAFKNALRDHPDQVILALLTAARAAGVAGGIGGRAGLFGKAAKDYSAKHVPVTVPGENVIHQTYIPPVMEVPNIPLGPGGVGSYVDDLAAVRAAAQVKHDAAVASGEIKGTMVNSPPINIPVEIGVTGTNLLDIFWLRTVKANRARLSSKYRDKLSAKAAETKFRRQYNIEQGIRIKIRSELSRPFGRAPSNIELDRVGFNLSWPAISLRGENITPGWIAQQFRNAIDEYKRNQAKHIDLYNETTKEIMSRAEQAQQIKLWEDQIVWYEKLDSVVIPEDTMAKVRAIAKPLGEENTRIIAELMGEDVTAAKRANYIRLIHSNDDLSVLAAKLKADRNASRKSFILSQHNVRRIARKYAEKVTPSGVGAKSRPKSVVAQAEQKADLLAALLKARDDAIRVSLDRGLSDVVRQDASVAAREYSSIIARLEASGVGVADRAAADAAIVAEIDALTLSDEAAAGLVPEAQAAYSAAQAAEAARAAQAGVVSGLEAQRAAALGEVAPLTGTQPLKAANTAAVRAAQARVDRAAKRVKDISARKLPSKKELAAATAELDAAQARLARLGAVQEVDVALTGAKDLLVTFNQTRNARVREVKAILAKNRPVLDVEDVTISVDAAEGVAGVRVRTQKEYGFFKLLQAKNEVLDDFIARMEGADQQALLHIMVTKDMLRPAEKVAVSGPRVIDAGATVGIRRGRLIQSQGILFKSGQEQAKFWERLLFDTAELKTSQAWQRKIRDLIDATCLPVKPTQKTFDKAADYEAQGMEPQAAITQAIKDEDILKSALDFEVIRPSNASAGVPPKGVSIGVARDVSPQTVEDMFLSHISLDKLSDDDYLLMPRGVYDGIQAAIANQSFKFTPGGKFSLAYADKITRIWRDLTLNIFPKTAFNNFVGSGILAFMAGATPRDFWYAYRAIMGKADSRGRVFILPDELRQRYYEQLTTRVPAGLALKIADTHATTETALGWVAYWMNTMRRLNGASEDLSRVAVWYSQARRNAVRSAAQDAGEIAYFAGMRRLTDDAMDVIDAMARNDPRWESLNELFLQKSFDFLGDLHKGGAIQAKLRLAIPFYQWYAHIFKLTFFTMPLKYPGRALFLQMLGSIGEEYVKEHGILPSGFEALGPVFEGVIPISTSTERVGGAPQKVTLGFGSNSWWPQGTTAPFATQPIDAFYGAINPLIRTPALGIASTLSGVFGSGAFNLKSGDFVVKAKDENGNPIDGPNGLFWWNFNNAFNIMPLAPSLFDLGGKAGTSVPIFHERPRATSSLEISNPTPNVSFWEAITDPSFGHSFSFIGRFAFGLNLSRVPGVGPTLVEKYSNAYKHREAEERQRMQNIADNLARLHAEQNK